MLLITNMFNYPSLACRQVENTNLDMIGDCTDDCYDRCHIWSRNRLLGF